MVSRVLTSKYNLFVQTNPKVNSKITKKIVGVAVTALRVFYLGSGQYFNSKFGIGEIGRSSSSGGQTTLTQGQGQRSLLPAFCYIINAYTNELLA